MGSGGTRRSGGDVDLPAGGPASQDHWSELARRWDLSGPPLRLSPEDVDAYRDAVAELIEGRPAPRALILGVTPDLYRLPWPDGADVRAVDRSRAMIELVWPGSPSAVRQEEWTALTLPDSSRDVVLCDGGFHLLSHPDGQRELVRELDRVLSVGGLFVTRLFVPPSEPEAPDEVIEDLRGGRVASVNHLKLRLDMALQRGTRQGVRLGEVWDVFHAAEPDPERLAGHIGWTLDEVRSVEAYSGSTSTYHFVSLQGATDLFHGARFRRLSVRTPSYELGERCPVVVFERTED